MKKKSAAIIISAILAGTLAVGGTLALLHRTTQTVTNVFASNKTLSDNLKLREPTWDGYDFTDKNSKGNDPVGDEAKPLADDTTDSSLGFNQAKNYTPGEVINKNPQVKNLKDADGNQVDAYVALKVQYYSVDANGNETEMNYADFKTAYLATDLDFSSAWIANTEKSIFIFGADGAATVLKAGGAATAPLFTKVPLSYSLTEPLPKFEIKVTAYGIQTDNVTPAQAVTTLTNWVNGTYSEPTV